jgi:hypothetical protein
VMPALKMGLDKLPSGEKGVAPRGNKPHTAPPPGSPITSTTPPGVPAVEGLPSVPASQQAQSSSTSETVTVPPAQPEPPKESPAAITSEPPPSGPVPPAAQPATGPATAEPTAPATQMTAPTADAARPAAAAPAGQSQSPGTPLATTEPQTPTPAPVPLPIQERMADFVAHYDGGPCFFLTPAALTPNSARIEGFGLSRDPFDTFITRFREAFQIEPDIVLGPIDKAQCPAVDFLAATRTGAIRAGTIQLDSTRLGARDRLSGTVDVGGAGDVRLLLVSASGVVSRLADPERDGTGVRRFNYDIGKSPGKFLLIAIATAQPLEGLTQRSVSAESFFPLVLQKAREANRTFVAAAKYFERRG